MRLPHPLRCLWTGSSIRSGRGRLAALLGIAASGLVAIPAAPAQSWVFVDVIRETNLDFGQAVQGIGTVQRHRTSPDIVRFKITGSIPGAGTGQRVVSLAFYAPGNLSGPASGLVPLTISGAYNSLANDAATATTFSGTTVDIPLRIFEGYEGGFGVYSAYAYVFGSVIVGTVPVGSYSGEISVVATQLDPDGGTGSVGCNVAWDPSVWYNTGDWVEYQGNAWRSLWWNSGNVPGSSGGGSHPWEAMGPCEAPEEGPGCAAFAWNSTRIYDSGNWATYGGKAWRALYYTRDQIPGSGGSSGAWEEMGPCDGTPWGGTGCAALPWALSRIYHTNDEVTHAGAAWRAVYYTRGVTPGGGGWQQIQSCGMALVSPFRRSAPDFGLFRASACHPASWLTG